MSDKDEKSAAATPLPRIAYNTKEVAEMLGVSVRTIQRAVREEKLRAHKTGKKGRGSYLFKMEDVNEWFDSLDKTI